MGVNRPGLGFMGNTGIRTKLWGVVLVLSIPLAALSVMQYQRQNSEISRANSESDGFAYVAATMPFLREVQQHRSLAERYLSGQSSAEAALKLSGEAGDAALSKLEAAEKSYGGDLGTKQYIDNIRSQWPRLRDIAAGQSASDVASAHTQLINESIFPLLDRVTIASKLQVDPSVDTRSAIVALTDVLPKMTESLSLARSYGATLLAGHAGHEPTIAQRQYLASQVVASGIYADTMVRNLQASMAGNKDFEAALKPLLDRSQVNRTSFMTASSVDVLNASTLLNSAAESYFLLGGSAIDSSNQLIAAAQGVLDKEFQARRDSAASGLYITSAATLGGIAVAVAFALLIAFSITRPIRRLAEVADRMSLGELDIEIGVEGKNEVGQLAESLRRMQASLRSAIERLRARRAA
ncbi:MAG: HAMP domain-containing protein [Dehalococcoidia bacterium]|nr:HAMP domain-containing protein [Dehalococcoidia bacterium]